MHEKPSGDRQGVLRVQKLAAVVVSLPSGRGSAKPVTSPLAAARANPFRPRLQSAHPEAHPAAFAA
jgi:hypothetical protein